MDLRSARALKTELLDTFARERAGRVTASAESLLEQPPEARVAAGYIHLGRNEYRLEIRIQREEGWAARTAREFEKKAAGPVHIEVVERVEIPPRSEMESLPVPPWLDRKPNRRPLHLGLPIGHSDDGSGTLGLFVDTRDGDMILSCNHVLALFNEAAAGKNGGQIFQPGPAEAAPRASNLIARVQDYVVLRKGHRNNVDAAIARLSNDIPTDGNIVPRGYSFPREGQPLGKPLTPDEFTALTPGTRVAKIGRTTGYTVGQLTSIDLGGVPVFTGTLGNIIFDDVVEITWDKSPFSQAGDSGSIIFSEEGLRPLALLFAGSPQSRKTYACALHRVLAEFDAVPS